MGANDESTSRHFASINCHHPEFGLGQLASADSLALTYNDGQGNTAPYRLFLPPNYSPDQAYPLVLYMHGLGERGADNLLQLNGIDALIAATQSEQYASYLLAPQIQVGVGWSSELGSGLTRGIVDEVLGNYVVDSSRVYATGFSAGGTGTFAQVHESDLYAAGVPIASGLNGLTPELAEELAAGYVDMPLWVFHGAFDVFWPAEKARLFVDAIRAAGGSPIYTEFPDLGHGIREIVYEDDNAELYGWLFDQQRIPASSPGDFNLDGDVDGHDFLRWQRGESPHQFSITDLYNWQSNYGVASLQPSQVAVPEPSCLALTVTILAGAGLGRRRRKTGTPAALVAVVASCILNTPALHADIYQWEHIDPGDPSRGRRQSSTLAPDGLGVEPEPRADLRNLDLSTAWLHKADMARALFNYSILTNADLSRSNLSDAKFGGATLAGAELANAEVRGATFAGTVQRGFTSAQLYSTASYQRGDLSGIRLDVNDLKGWIFAGKNLADAFFGPPDDDIVEVPADLSDADLSDANLTNASLAYARLSGTDLVGADIRGASLRSTTSLGFTEDQLYSTASYQERNLAGINFSGNDLAGWSFAGQTLIGANFMSFDLVLDFEATVLNDADFTEALLTDSYFGTGFGLKKTPINAELVSAQFTRADTRGATGLLLEPRTLVTQNTVFPDGSVYGFEISADETMRIRDYDSVTSLLIHVHDRMQVDTGGALRLVFDDVEWGSTISFDAAITVSLAGTLELLLDDDVSPTALVGTTFQVFDWTGVEPIGQFDKILTQNGLIWNADHLYTSGEVTLIAAIPEPNALTMLGTGATLFALIQRYRN